MQQQHQNECGMMPPVVYGDFGTLSKKVQEFVRKNSLLCRPDKIHICDGTDEENKQLIQFLVNKGVAEKLAHEKHENCYVVRTDPRDVARVEARTFICTDNKHDAVPHFTGDVGRLGRWLSVEEANKKLADLYPGCMKGRTMYVIPFSMGPIGSPVSKIGIELTDSEYVVCCMRIMTRMGSKVLKALGDGDFVKGLHSVGCPIEDGKEDVKWPCNPEKTIITHFVKDFEIKSFGSGYGGNSLLGKKCFALRIASNIARKEGWLAEHMMILGLTSPEGKKTYVAAAFPSACGKTNLAMLTPTLPGWKAECIGDDIAWMWFDKDGTLRAINPESGFFGVAPGTSFYSNPMAMSTFQKDTIFTNVATTSDGDFYWEGLDKPKNESIKSWLNVEEWEEGQGKAAHPNSRFCAPSDHCPIMDEDWENPKGVPISAILFGGRRPHGVPLCFEAFNWKHGVFVASALSSEATAAAEFKGKTIMRDPFAMRPFFGYNFGRYLEHWLSMENTPDRKLPKIFHVNWFRVDDHGHFLWPGFGENCRVLEWIIRRVNGEDIADVSPIGFIPKPSSINLSCLKPKPDIDHCLLVRKNYWLEEVDNLRLYYEKEVGEDLPQAIKDELNALEVRVNAMEDQQEGPYHSSYYQQAIELHKGEIPPVAYGDFNALSKKVQEFVKENAILCQPDRIHICDGSACENQSNIDILVKRGVAKALSHEKHENCYCVFTDPRDVARVEARTFLCTEKKHDSVPHFKGQVGRLGRWMSIDEANKKLDEYYPGCMRGRTMYVIPFSMGPIGSPVSKIGIELTDSEYVVCCMRIMTRMGSKVLKALGDGDFVKGLHSVGFPLKWGEVGPKWPCNPEKTIITHFPQDYTIKSFGSGYGGNSLLGKKCFALRIASNIARKEGWLAEHMMILGLTNPEGKKIYVAAAFPSACGKTNLAMITPTLPGWKAECIGDDICWMWFDKEGTLRAINPESGFFGVAPGTTEKSNPIAMKTFQRDTVFTNVAIRSDGDFYWEGLPNVPEGVNITSWLGVKNWTEGQGKAAHPNSRFCAPSDHCPIMDKDWENPKGVPISAILFGGRRPHGVPLIYEAFNWEHGVFVASALSSEATAAAEFKGKTIMRDPFAMRPFFGYNFGKYLEHWLSMENTPGRKLPKIFHVNWFRVDEDGHFLWPGFGENSRVLEYVFRRVNGEDIAVRSQVGLLPRMDAINLEGLDPAPDMAHLLLIRKKYWLDECKNLRQYFDDEVGEDLPQAITNQLKELEERLSSIPDEPVPQFSYPSV